MLTQAQIFFVFMFLAMPSFAASTVNVTVDWEYKNFPLKIELYELRPRYRNMISKTEAIPLKENVPALAVKWKGINREMKKGGGEPFALMLRNDSDKDLYFYAAPHTVDPPEAALGHFFECLCNQSIYRVPAKSIWYRIVRVNLWQKYPQKKAKFVHAIVGVSEADAKGKLSHRLFRE